MKHTLALLFALATLTAYAQKEADVLKEARKLVADKKYESAFKALEAFDKDNTKPGVALLKAEIVEEYFVTSFSHQMFALKDLEPGESIMDYRGTQGQFSMHSFAVNDVLEALLAKNPNNCALYAGLGHFYYEAYTHYPNGWLIEQEELLNRITTNYKKAVEGKCADAKAYESLGFAALTSEDYAAAIPYYQEAIKLDKEYPTSYYNLAYACLYANDRSSAITYGKEAFNRYTDPAYKADAARMVGIAYSEVKDTANAIKWYEQADSTDPKNYYTLRPLLRLYVETGSPKAAAALDAFFNLAPEKPTIYSDLEEIYTDDKAPALILFYNTKLGTFNGNDRVVGNLHFYLGSLQVDTDKKQAHTHFLKAKEYLTKVLEPGNEAFGIIEQALEYTK